MHHHVVYPFIVNYCKISDKSWAYIKKFCSKGFFDRLTNVFLGELIFRGNYYWMEFCVSKWFGLDSTRH